MATSEIEPPPGRYGSPVPVNTYWAANILIVSIVLSVVASVAFVGRWLARRIRMVPFGVDDWLMLIALILFFAHAVVSILEVVLGGIGHHTDQLKPEVIRESGKVLLALTLTYTLSLGLAKLSMCCLLARVFSGAQKFRIAAWATTAIVAAWIFSSCVVALAICRPIEAQWEITGGGRCMDAGAATYALGIIDTVIDFLIIVLPIPQIWRLQMPQTSKIGLSALFGLGVLDFALGIARIVSLHDMIYQEDTAYTLARVLFWSAMRPGLAIVIGCALVMRPLLERYFPSIVKSKENLDSGKAQYMMTPVTRKKMSDEDMADLLNQGRSDMPGETRSVAVTRNKDATKTSLALPGQTPRRTTPTPPRQYSKDDDVINVHRFVQVEEENIGCQGDRSGSGRPSTALDRR